MLFRFRIQSDFSDSLIDLLFPDLPADAGEKLQILSGAVSRKKARRLDNGANTLRRFNLFPDLFSIHQNRSIVHPKKSTDAFEQNRLATSVSSDHSVNFSFFKAQADPVQRRVAAKLFCHVFYSYLFFHSFRFPPQSSDPFSGSRDTKGSCMRR